MNLLKAIVVFPFRVFFCVDRYLVHLGVLALNLVLLVAALGKLHSFEWKLLRSMRAIVPDQIQRLITNFWIFLCLIPDLSMNHQLLPLVFFFSLFSPQAYLHDPDKHVAKTNLIRLMDCCFGSVLLLLHWHPGFIM